MKNEGMNEFIWRIFSILPASDTILVLLFACVPPSPWVMSSLLPYFLHCTLSRGNRSEQSCCFCSATERPNTPQTLKNCQYSSLRLHKVSYFNSTLTPMYTTYVISSNGNAWWKLWKVLYMTTVNGWCVQKRYTRTALVHYKSEVFIYSRSL